MAIPKYDELFEPVLQILKDRKDHTSKEMRDAIAASLQLSEEELAEYLPSKNQRVFDNRIGWARTYLKKAGLMSSPKRGTYRIEQRGIEALASGAPITNEYLDRFESFRTFKAAGKAGASKTDKSDADARDSAETPDEVLEQAYNQIVAQLADELLDEVMKLTPTTFEQMVLDLMSAMGYGSFDSAAKTTPASGDEGIDGVIMQDQLGFDLIYVQAKHYAADHVVGRPDIQAFVGAIAGRGGNGLFVTTSAFSKQAIDYARHQHIILIDGDKLAHLMIEHGFGVTVKRRYEIKAVDTDVFNAYTEG